GVPPKMDERVNIGRRCQKEVVPPFVVTDIQAPVLVHPVDKFRRMKEIKTLEQDKEYW
ncbi:jg21318, partial [Pararge aegeria aegeria]